MEPKDELKLDIKDRKILAQLELDSRQPLSAIGKKAGLSKAGVSSRIARIEKSGLVDRFNLELNYAALGTTNYRYYFKFESTPPGFEQSLAEYLYTHGNVRWFCLMQGQWDLVVRFFAADDAELSDFENSFMEKFGKQVKSKAYGVNLFGTNHRCTQLTGNEGSYYRQTRSYKGGRIRLTPIDYCILFRLYENSRASLREIAEKEGLSAETVAYHVKGLGKKQAFFACSVRFNRSRAGYMGAKVLLNLQYLTPEKREAFLAYCDATPILSHYLLLRGPWDAELDCDVKSPAELYAALRKIRNRFPDLIREFSVLTKIKEYEANPFASLAGKRISKSEVPDFSV
ncbi:putative HTH-type transcriptional regulator [uncultured archaeon]|nr:putative HTH-type transcriptional regulator [uncultured archaeon]